MNYQGSITHERHHFVRNYLGMWCDLHDISRPERQAEEMNDLVLLLIVMHAMFLYWVVVEYNRIVHDRKVFIREIIAYLCSSPPIDIDGKTKYISPHSVEIGWALLSSGVRVGYCLTDRPCPVTQRQLFKGEVASRNFPVFVGGFLTSDGSIQQSKQKFAESTKVRLRVAAND